jgi:hypothetical protein
VLFVNRKLGIPDDIDEQDNLNVYGLRLGNDEIRNPAIKINRLIFSISPKEIKEICPTSL